MEASAREFVRSYAAARASDNRDDEALLEQGEIEPVAPASASRSDALPSFLSARTSWVATVLLVAVAIVALAKVVMHASSPGMGASQSSVMLADIGSNISHQSKSDHASKAKSEDSDKKEKSAEKSAAKVKGSSNVTAKPTEEPCHTSKPGEVCYDSVLWHKWIGLIENPAGYHGISRESNRHQIQEYLHKTKQGNCPKPCDGAYPVPGKVKKNWPSIFCFSVARLGTEMDTMFLQRQTGSGIFGCDGHAVFSDNDVDIDGFKTTKISSTASGVSVDKTAANSQVFMRTWSTLLELDEWWQYDFIAKVDPDAVIFADRMRGHLASHTGQDVFFLNCNKYIPETMYGALEVFSKAAMGAYQSQHTRCEKALPYWDWGEDRYMANCLEMLDVHTQPEENNFLHDERCWGVDCGNKAAVAFHAFKHVNTWYRCYLESK